MTHLRNDVRGNRAPYFTNSLSPLTCESSKIRARLHRPHDQLGPDHILQYVAHLSRDGKLLDNSRINRSGL
jgi:hypothetical protein